MRKNIFLFIVLFLAFIFRFWHYPLRYGIGYDGSRDAIVAFESARQLQLPLTGSFSSVAPVTFGPWYYFYITLANFVIPSIWAPWISIGIASLCMVLIMYFVGLKLLKPKFGLILAFFTAISPAQISASSSLQQHALIGFLSSLAILVCILIIQRTKVDIKIYMFWGFVVGVAINTHFQALGLISLPLLAFLVKRNIRLLLFFSLGFFISMIPILIFELNNHWFNTKNIIDYIFIGQYRVWTSNRWLTFLGSFFPQFWSYTTALSFPISFFCMLASGFIVSLALMKKKISASFFVILISFVVLLVLLRYYRGEKFFGYLQFFHPYIFLFTGLIIYYVVKIFRNKIFPVLISLFFIIFVIPSTLNGISIDQLNQQSAIRFNILIHTYPHDTFSTYECNIYDIDRIQGLTLYLYMHDKYSNTGKKITIFNEGCRYDGASTVRADLIDVTTFSDEKLDQSGLHINSPQKIYEGTARWWFKEQP